MDIGVYGNSKSKRKRAKELLEKDRGLEMEGLSDLEDGLDDVRDPATVVSGNPAEKPPTNVLRESPLPSSSQHLPSLPP